MRSKWYIVGAIGVVFVFGVGLGYFWYFGGAFPVSKQLGSARRYWSWGKQNDLTGLLRAERMVPMPTTKNNIVVSDLRITEEQRGDKIETYYDFAPDPTYSNSQLKPVEPVSFLKTKFGTIDGYILSERFINKNGSVSYLHFGYANSLMNLDDVTKELEHIISNKNVYLVPMVSMVGCSYHQLSLTVCENYDGAKLSPLFDEWMNTGNIPHALETEILIPVAVEWEVE